MAASVHNLILDLGGVILELDYTRTTRAFAALGLDIDRYFTQLQQNHIFDRLETGHLSPQEFRDYIRNETGLALSDTQIDDAWNAMLGQLPPARLDFLQTLGTRYRLFLLSNTNAIHIAAFKQIAEQVTTWARWNELFEHCYYSHDLGLRKPNPEVFEYILQAHQLDPAHTLFIDDSPQHIAGAQQVGLQAIHATQPLETILVERGLV